MLTLFWWTWPWDFRCATLTTDTYSGVKSHHHAHPFLRTWPWDFRRATLTTDTYSGVKSHHHAHPFFVDMALGFSARNTHHIDTYSGVKSHHHAHPFLWTWPWDFRCATLTTDTLKKPTPRSPFFFVDMALGFSARNTHDRHI